MKRKGATKDKKGVFFSSKSLILFFLQLIVFLNFPAKLDGSPIPTFALFFPVQAKIFMYKDHKNQKTYIFSSKVQELKKM